MSLNVWALLRETGEKKREEKKRKKQRISLHRFIINNKKYPVANKHTQVLQ
jgi:hypothetical protein